MSDFWTKKLGRQAPPQQPPPGPQHGAPAPQRPWWDQSAPPPPPAPQQPAQGYGGYPQQGYPQQQGYPPQGYPQQGYPQDPEQAEIERHTKHARKAKQNSTCPECGGPNYTSIGSQFFKNHGQVEQRRCFDCGYPITQQFSGMSGVTEGQAQGKARQVAHGGANVHNAQLGSTQAPLFASPHGGPGR